MQILTTDGGPGPAPQAPPSATPTPPPSTPAPTHATTSAPATQLPTTGPSDVATGALAIGLPVLLVGAVLIVLARRWRARTD